MTASAAPFSNETEVELAEPSHSHSSIVSPFFRAVEDSHCHSTARCHKTMAAARTGGDDLTENWASDEAQVNKKRKHDNPTAAQPAATSKPKKIKTKHIPATARPSADQPATAGSQRALCFHSADEQATGFWQLYLQSKGGKLLTTIEQSAQRTALLTMLSSAPHAF